MSLFSTSPLLTSPIEWSIQIIQHIPFYLYDCVLPLVLIGPYAFPFIYLPIADIKPI